MTDLKVIICFLAELVMASVSMNYSAECDRIANDTIRVIQGEALRLLCPNFDCSNVENNSFLFWFKTENAKIQPIMTEENERVHYHGGVLYFLPLSLNDTGLYITQWWSDISECEEFVTEVIVYEQFHPDQLYPRLLEQISILPLECPVYMQTKVENITWYKDFRLIPGQSEAVIQIYLVSEDANGIYTCVCTWEHSGQVYNSSASRYIQRKEDIEVPFGPTIQYPVNNSVKVVDLGADVQLNCLVFFGMNIRDQSGVYWMRNNSRLNCFNRMEDVSVLSTLTITQVSERDTQNKYCCVAVSQYYWSLVCITLRTRESLLPVAVVFSSMFLFILLSAGVVKWFTVDLVLFFRSFNIMQRKSVDGKLYDAYVIYQKDNTDDTTGRKVAHFVNKVLPTVLENSCGFKLYIQGRDDLPGEDCAELIESKMQQSRRLIAVLPPGLSRHGYTTALCYDWHVGLHQVLVEQEMKVILIQLEDMKEYSHLPLGLQHLLQKTSPLRWDESTGKATCPTSRFWKQVRYMMPVPAASSSCGTDLYI